MLRILVTIHLLIVPALIAAGDQALYDKPPPPGSAFVRLLSGSDTVTSGEVDGVGEIAIDPGVPSPYFALVGDRVEIAIGGDVLSIDLVPGRFLTAVYNSESAVSITEDLVDENPTKAGVQFYNLTDIEDVSLVAPQFQAVVVEKVAPWSSGYREINEVTLTLAAHNNESQLVELKEVLLKRRNEIAIVLSYQNKELSLGAHVASVVVP